MAIDQLATEQPLARCRAVLAENKAKAVNLERFDGDSVHSWANGFAEEWRMWELPTTDDASLYLDFLTTYTSAANAKASQFVTDPRIAGEKLDGVWRQVAARKMRRGGKVYLVQGLRRVYTPASVAELAALPYRRTRKHEILAPFSLGAGEGDEVGFVWEDLNPSNETAFRALTAAALVKDLPGAGWTYVDRAFTHQGSNVAQGVVVFRKVAWSAFDYSKPDLTEYQNYGTEHQEIDESYFGINNTDALANLYTAAAKYNVMRVKITERGDGALNITRTSIHEVYGSAGPGAVQALSQETMNVHGLVAGTLDGVLVINENLKALTSAYTALPGGYTLAWMKEQLQGSGLWNKYYFYSKATWTNTTPTYTQNGRGDVGGWGESKHEIANGVPIADAATKVAAKAADTGFVIGNVSFQEGLPGEARIGCEQRKTFDYGSGAAVDAPVKVRILPVWGKQRGGVEFWWPRVTPARIDTVVGKAELLASYNTWFTDAYPSASGWAVQQVEIRREPDGAATVVGTLGIPTETADSTFESWYAATDVWYSKGYVRDSDGEIIKTITYGNQRAHRITQGDAEDWLTAKNAAISPKTLLKGDSGITRPGPNRYVADACWIESEA